MSKQILLASVSVQGGLPATEFRFGPGIHVLWGNHAEDVLLTLAGIFSGFPPKNAKAEVQWSTDVSLSVSVTDGACFVDTVRKQRGSPAQLAKAFHKQRFLCCRNCAHILDGSRLSAGTSGASDLLLEKLNATITQKDARPLFICNFFERLDEAVDLQSIFEALNATGRQVFIAVPRYYNIKNLEEKGYGATIHYESNL